MKDQLSILEQWQQQTKKTAIARVVKTWNASPRPVGSVMLINEDQEMAGSVSGGCVEGAVVKAALEVMDSNRPQLLEFGVSDGDAWSVGLSCGGRIQVLVEPLPAADNPVFQAVQRGLLQNEGVIWISPVEDFDQETKMVSIHGQVIGPVEEDLREKALSAYRDRKSQIVEVAGKSWFLHVLPQKDQLFVIGAAHLTVDLVELAHSFGFECIVIDPRSIFAHKTQFRQAPDQLFNDYPSEILPDFDLGQHCFAVVLSHDPKIDDNALHLLLPADVPYIGALGSRRTHAKRVKRLLEAGFSQEQVDRIYGPVGIDINAKTPREIALSIMAQIIEVKNQFL